MQTLKKAFKNIKNLSHSMNQIKTQKQKQKKKKKKGNPFPHSLTAMEK
jgi:hypothetical protein